MENIKKQAGERDLSAIGDLYESARAIAEYKKQYVEIENLVQRLEARFNSQDGEYGAEPNVRRGFDFVPNEEDLYVGSQTKERAKKIRIEVDWSRLGKAGGQEVISEHMASASLELFLRKLSSACGVVILERLRGFRVSRGPMVSDAPQRDYLNTSTGSVYANQRIGTTGFYVLTNTSTAQKVADVAAAMKFLELPFGFVRVSEVSK